jgi:metallo-beta-lactamase family protein
MGVRLTFLGAVGTVTGSKYLLESDGARVLIDCGLFQGFKQLRLRNWAQLPVDPQSIAEVLLTHAHLDHSGYLPLLVRNGFRGRILSTEATRDLCGILLPDSGFLQERDAEFANRHGFSKHHPALPLYTQADADAALKRFSTTAFAEPQSVPGGWTARFLYAGHLLGAAMIELRRNGVSIVFSGDLGRPNSPSLREPAIVEAADYLVLESTYGNRKHDTRNPEDVIAEIVNRTAARGGSILIPAFAVGRAQDLLLLLYRLRRQERIPALPVFIDSPMAVDASDIFRQRSGDHRLDIAEVQRALAAARPVQTSEESKALDASPMPKVIVSASGMATGGRVLHHLKSYAPDPRNTILFSGFQAGGTRGAAMVAGADSIKIHGTYIPVRASVEILHALSAHADAGEILGWLRHFKRAPKTVFITHGEPDAADALRRHITEDLGWTCSVPEFRDEVTLHG